MRRIQIFIQVLTKFEKIIFFELNVLYKRYFLIYLSNIFVNEFVYAIFSGMRSDYVIYIKIKYRVQRSYKI